MPTPIKNERLDLPSASSVYRLKACPGSYHLSMGIEAFRTQQLLELAEAGDRIHEVMAGLLPKFSLPDDQQELVDRMNEVDKYILEQAGMSSEQHVREQRLWLAINKKPILSGKADDIAMEGLVGVVIDYKSSYGDQDAADENYQLRAYVVLAAEANPFIETWYAAINQPLVTMQPTVVKYTRDDVAAARNEIVAIVQAAMAENAVTTSGRHCKYCPAVLRCPSAKALLQTFGLISTDTDNWTSEHLKGYLDLIEAAKPIIKSIEAHAKDFMAKGGVIDGWQIGKGAKTREITDPFAAFKLLSDAGAIDKDAFTECLSVGVGDLEKAVAKFKGIRAKEAKDEVNSLLVPVIKFGQKAGSLERL